MKRLVGAFIVLILATFTHAADRPAWYPSEDVIESRVQALQQEFDAACAYYTRQLVGEYEAHGARQPAWDDAVRRVLEINARERAIGGDRDTYAQRLVAINIAGQLRPNDDLFRYLYARAMGTTNVPTEMVRAETHSACHRLLASKYQGLVRMYAMLVLATAEMEGPQPSRDPQEAQRQLQAFLAALPEFVKSPDFPVCEVYTIIDYCGDASLVVYGDRARFAEQVFTVLDKHLVGRHRSAMLAAKGDLYVTYAWDARGAGFAHTVTPEASRLMAQRLNIARQALTKAWEIDNTNPFAAGRMIAVLKGTSGDFQEMEKWFARAVAANPFDTRAYGEKLDFLKRKWHGSDEQMLTFAREVAQTLPDEQPPRLVLRLAHEVLTNRTRSDGIDPALAKAYFENDPEAWQELKDLADSMIDAGFDSAFHRLQFARLAVAAGDHKSASAYIKGIDKDIAEAAIADKYAEITSALGR